MQNGPVFVLGFQFAAGEAVAVHDGGIGIQDNLAEAVVLFAEHTQRAIRPRTEP